MQEARALSTEFRLVAAGMRELARLDALGLNDSDEADAVRDTMDAPWYRLSVSEEKLARILSADLYSLTDPPHDVEPMNSQAQDKLKNAVALAELGDGAGSLALLRRWGRFVDPAILAFVRGWIWSRFGDLATAYLFFRRECELAPEDEQAPLGCLFALAKSDTPAAVAQAVGCVESSKVHSMAMVSLSVSILYQQGWHAGDKDRMASLIEAAHAAYSRCANVFPPDPHSTAGGYRKLAASVLAFLHADRGDRDEALGWFDKAMAIDPFDEELRSFRAQVAAGGVIDRAVVQKRFDMAQPVNRLAGRFSQPLAGATAALATATN